MQGVIDRFEGQYAVLLVGENEQQLEVPSENLPADAQEGDWLKISFAVDEETTSKQEKKVTNLINKLKNKNQ
jgi:hypothetical protein